MGASIPTTRSMIKSGGVRTFRWSFPCFLTFLFLAKSLFAQIPERRISQYGHTVWRLQDGYFAGQPTSITQTADGYIWIGTQAGLFRFDGVRFVPWSSLDRKQLPSNLIVSLLTTRDGTLWIGTDAGLAHWVNQHLETYLRGALIPPMVEDEKGRIWVAPRQPGDYTPGLCQVADTAVRCYTSQDGVPPATAGGPVVQDLAGNIWAGGATTLLRWRPGSSYAYRPKALKGNEGLDGVDALSVAPDGSLWVGMALPGPGLGLQHLVDGNLESFVVPKLNGETLEVLALLNDRDNSLWVGSANHGLYRIHGTDVDHYGSANGLSSDSVLGFFEDHEANLWVATSQGVDMFRALRVTSFSKREGLTVDNVDSVLGSRQGKISVGTATDLEVLGPNGFSPYSSNALQGHQVTALLEDHAGRLWVGIGNKLLIYEGGRLTQIKKQDGKPIGIVMGLTEDSEHNIWAESFGPPGTLIRIQDLKVREEFPAPAMPLARQIVADPQSGIWLGLMDGDLARFRSHKIETFRFGEHPDSRVKAIIAVSDGSILGATAFGVVGWKNGKQQLLNVRNGLPCESFSSLISDNQGDLWLYGECGLIEIAKDELQRWWEHPERRLTSRVFDTSDGTQPGLGHFNSSTKTPDGRLWFANGSVLQMIDPANIAGNPVAPPVHVETISVDRKPYSPQEGLRLPPLTRDLEIDYTALSFVAPHKVRFRYKLEGHDTKWQEPGTRRQAFYNDLRPGKYRFRVIACNNDGLWNEEGAVLDFSIAPTWYQTNLFLCFCVATGVLIVWVLYGLRTRQLARTINARFDERLADRTRLARELHDTFLQTIQGSKLVVDDALKKSGDYDRMQRAMKQLSVWLDQAVHEGRATLNSLRTSTTHGNDLAEALGRATEECRMQGSMEVSFLVVGDPGEMSPIVRDEVYRIGYEAIRNACTHSAGSRLEVELQYRQDLALCVRDDGKGIEPEILSKGKDSHFGLRGMRERATRIRSILDIRSSPDSGTTIQLTVPGGIAFIRKRPVRPSLLTIVKRFFGEPK